MYAIWTLFALRIRLLRNRLRVGSRAGRVGMLLLRSSAYLMGFAFLRFGSKVMAETARDAATRYGAPAGEFFFAASLGMATAIIFVVNLLVFAAEEFDTTDSTRDTAFLLSLPVSLRQVVWAKALLRSTVDVYGVFLLVPLLWGLWLTHPSGLAGALLAVLLFFLIELSAILFAMAAFVWTAQVVRYDRLELIRLALGLVLPGLASGAIVMLRHSVNNGALATWSRDWGGVVAWTPAARVVDAMIKLGHGDPAGAASAAALGLGVFALCIALFDLAIALPKRALARVQEGSGRSQVTGSATGLLGRVRSPLWMLVAKDCVLLWRRPVFLLTTVLFPLSITGINLLSLITRAELSRTGYGVSYLLPASVYVSLLILPFLGAAQSFGQTEHGRIGMLQGLPIPMSRLMSSKVLLFVPLVVGSAVSLQLAGEYAFRQADLATTPSNVFWTAVAAVLATHVAVASAALFPVFEFGVLAVRGANMAIGGMLHFTVAAVIGLLAFPLKFENKLIVLALVVPLVTYLWRKGADRLAYYDEGTTLARSRDLNWEEAYILFGVYAALQVVVYVALLFAIDMPPETAVQWSLDFSCGALVLLGGASLYYVSEKGPTARATLGLAPERLRGAILPGLATAGLALVALPRLMALFGGGGGTLANLLKSTSSWHLVASVGGSAVLVAPIAEELFFRGVLYGAARASFPRAFAALIAALIFALMHWDRTMPAMLVLALALTALYERTGTLYAPMIAHAAFNAVGLAAFGWYRGAPAGVPMPVYLGVVLGALPLAFAAALARLARAYSDHERANAGDSATQ